MLIHQIKQIKKDLNIKNKLINKFKINIIINNLKKNLIFKIYKI